MTRTKSPEADLLITAKETPEICGGETYHMTFTIAGAIIDLNIKGKLVKRPEDTICKHLYDLLVGKRFIR